MPTIGIAPGFSQLQELEARITTLEESLTGPWTPIPVSSQVTDDAMECRLELNGAICRFKNGVTPLENIPAFTTLATLPVGFRPASGELFTLADNASASTLVPIGINASGTVQTRVAVEKGQFLSFEGVTFHLI